MAKYMIDCVATHRVRYCVEIKDTSELSDIIEKIENGDHNLEEFSQSFLGEYVVCQYEVTDDKYLNMFDNDNDYLETWTVEQKFKFINNIEEEKDAN